MSICAQSAYIVIDGAHILIQCAHIVITNYTYTILI